MQTLLFKLLRPLFLSFFFLIYLHASVTSPIDINTSINSEWTSDSNHSLYRSNSYVDYYTFTLSENTFVQIDLISSDVNTYLYLLDDNYQIIDENADSGEGVNAKIIKYLEPGTYIIGANNPIDYALGNYKVSLQKAIIPTLHDITFNNMIYDTLTTSSDTSLYSMNYSNSYTFTLSEKKDIVIMLDADFFKQIYLLDSNNSIIEHISEYSFASSKLVKTLESGTYTIDVTTKYENEIGDFTLILKENIIESTQIELNSIIDGAWTDSSGISPRSKESTNYYTFTLQERKDVVIDVDAIGSKKLYLLDNNCSIVESKFDIGYGHTKIIRTLEAGRYTIDLTRYYNNRNQIFTLRFKENIINNTNISIGSTINDTWNIASGVSSQSQNYTNYYTFILTESTNIIITLNGDDGYKQLYLLDTNNSIIDTVSKSGYQTARMIVTLPAGIYKIDATTTDNQIGNYTLKLNENIISTTNIELNTTIAGELLTSSGISLRSNSYCNYYLFTLTEKKDIIIYMSEKYSNIYLLDDNNSIIKASYGGFFEGNRLIKTLEPGTYKIDISLSSHTQTGEYNLSLRENIVSNVNIKLNSTINGEWLSTSGISPRTTKLSSYYTFILNQPTDIYIELVSDNHESLFLLDSNMSIIDSAWSQRIVKRLDAGIYTIDATINSGLEFGMYTLIFKENIISNTDIIFNENTYGEWISTSGVSSRSERYVNYYTFTLANSKEVTINVISENDMTFYIQDEGGSVFDSAYSYGDENATLRRLLDAGTYTIGITTYGNGNEVGNYSILLNTNIFSPMPVTQLSIASIDAYSSKIKWIDNVEDTVGYKIYLNNKLVANIDASENSYTLSGLNPESEYEYSVIAYNSAGESEAVSGSFKTKKDDYAWLIPVQYNILN